MTGSSFAKLCLGRIPLLILLVLFFYPGNMIGCVNAADAYFEGYLGDVIDIHGISYTGNEVYLFLTGPNLPAGGVELSDTTQRADHGHFTIVPLDSNQQWSYKWDTQGLKNMIDPGTYTIYVTTEPVDFSNLGGPSTYKSLEIYLQDIHAPQGESGPGTYTLNPEKHKSTPMPTIVIDAVNTSAPFLDRSPTTATPLVTTSTAALNLTPIPGITRAGLLHGVPFLAIALSLWLLFFRKSKS
jgi:hypothetical protein